MDTVINYKPEGLYSDALHDALLEKSKEIQFLGDFLITIDNIEYAITESQRKEIVSQSINTDENDPISLSGTMYHHKVMCRIWTVRKSNAQSRIEGNIENYSSFLDMLNGQQMRKWMRFEERHGKSVKSRKEFMDTLD